MLTDRKRRFATLYAKYGVAKRAAIEAGYSERSATSQGSDLLRDPDVQAVIAANRINRDVHAEKTYEELIRVKDVALRLVAEVMQGQAAEIRDKVLAIETAGRALERLARCEGLMVERRQAPDDVRSAMNSLQDLAKKAHELGVGVVVAALPMPAAAPAIQRQIDAAFTEKPINDSVKPVNGSVHGNGHTGSNGNGEAKSA